MTQIAAVAAGILLSAAWWNAGWEYRVPVVVRAPGTVETDVPVQVRLDFTGLLKDGERVDPGSIRVVEQDPAGGAAIAEVPALRQPVDGHWAGVAPLSRRKPYDAAVPPVIRATSENPAHPAKSLIEGDGYWEAGNPTPPWMLAVDLGAPTLINAVFPRSAFDGYGRHVPRKVVIETALESADGLREGTWERAGSCDEPPLGNFLPCFFAPRKARYVRVTIGGCNAEQPRLNALDVYAPFHHPAARDEWRVSWFVPGRTDRERLFYVYFRKAGPGAPPPAPPLPAAVALIREAEETVNTYHCSGVGFGRAFDSSASGPTNPNMLSFSWKADHFIVPAGFAVTVPRSGKYTVAMRVRGNAGDHLFRALCDNRAIFEGAFGLEGEDWNVVALPVMELPEGVHYLELQMKIGVGGRPLDLDMVTITDAAGFKPRQCLQAFPGKVQVRP